MDQSTPQTRNTVVTLRHEQDQLCEERDYLRRQLEIALTREKIANEREATLLGLLKQMQRQHASLSTTKRESSTTPSSTLALNARPRSSSANRECVLTYLEEHPGPHHHEEIRNTLDLPVKLRQMLKHMVNEGLIIRVKPGVYAAKPV